jgi:hypothetical protein
LVNAATVVYAEWAGGSMATLPNEAAGVAAERRFRSRAAAGGTYTFPIGLSLTVEAQANEAAPRKEEWQLLRARNPVAWGRALQWAFDRQELSARRSLFVYGQWRDAIVRRFDLSGFVQADEGSARQYWFEARRRFEGFDIALRWQAQRGPAWSRFGAASEQRSAQLIGTLYF